MKNITRVIILVSSLLLNTHPIEIRTITDGIGVRITRNAGLADDIALDGRKGGLCSQASASLKEVSSTVHALPTQEEARWSICAYGVQQFQNRQGVGGIGAGNPFLVIVHAVAIWISGIRVGIYGQAV